MEKSGNNFEGLDLFHVPFEDIMKIEGNVYRAVALISKRARELNTRNLNNLNNILEEFGANQEDATEICRTYEKKKKPHLEAIREFLNGSLEGRKKSDAGTNV